MESRNLKASKVVIGANILLISAKLTVALLTGSIGVLAVLADSLFDLFGSVLIYLGVKKGSEPADTGHHFGHGKYESFSSLAQLVLIAIAAAFIIGEAAHRISEPRGLEVTDAELAVMALAVLVDIGIVHYLRTRSDTASSAMQASVGNYTSDIFQNLLVLFGLSAVANGFPLADPIAALIVAGLMLRVVYQIGRETLGELTDASPPHSTLERYGRTIMSVKGIRHFHRMRARSAAGRVSLDLHIQLDPKMSLEKSHFLGHAAKAKLLEKFPEISEVLIHVEPFDSNALCAPKFGS